MGAAVLMLKQVPSIHFVSCRPMRGAKCLALLLGRPWFPLVGRS